MRKQQDVAAWKWIAMKAIVSLLVCVAAYTVFFNPPDERRKGLY